MKIIMKSQAEKKKSTTVIGGIQQVSRSPNWDIGVDSTSTRVGFGGTSTNLSFTDINLTKLGYCGALLMNSC